MIHGNMEFFNIRGIETHGYEIHPPRRKEKPAHCCLCYGSSITNSWLDGWPALLGHFLGMDVMNLGLSGGCCLEPELADYLAEPGVGEYDCAILELGINVIGKMCPEEFAARTDLFLRRITRAKPDVKIAMITIFPFNDDRSLWMKERLETEGHGDDPVKQFRTIIRETAEEYRKKGFSVSTVEGSEINRPELCWSWDLLHPRYLGNPVIAFWLSEILKKEWAL